MHSFQDDKASSLLQVPEVLEWIEGSFEKQFVHAFEQMKTLLTV